MSLKRSDTHFLIFIYKRSSIDIVYWIKSWIWTNREETLKENHLDIKKSTNKGVSNSLMAYLRYNFLIEFYYPSKKHGHLLSIHSRRTLLYFLSLSLGNYFEDIKVSEIEDYWTTFEVFKIKKLYDQVSSQHPDFPKYTHIEEDKFI